MVGWLGRKGSKLMKITIEMFENGKKKTIEREDEFAVVFTGKDTKDGQDIYRFIHFENATKKDFDNKRALLAEFAIIKALLAHFEKIFNAKLGVISCDNTNNNYDFLKFLRKIIKE